jgi:hypothetical protein
MNSYILYTLYAFCCLCFILALWSLGAWYAIRSLEEPKYTVEEVKDGYEFRKYAPTLSATTTVGGAEYDKALNEGFRRIADYIFGNNTAQSGIAMTVPVQESAGSSGTSAPIAMTVPVIEQGSSTQRTISFIMPSQYTLETIPKPNNPAVLLVENPAKRVAALRFSWFTNAARVEAMKKELVDVLTRDSVRMLTEPAVAFYNPPFTPAFMRRNEILIDVQK